MNNYLRVMHPLLYHKFCSNTTKRDYVGVPGGGIILERSTFFTIDCRYNWAKMRYGGLEILSHEVSSCKTFLIMESCNKR